jgi:(1->4)-alpha-D-glucan 1-alpha-D-glucosylmutase
MGGIGQMPNIPRAVYRLQFHKGFTFKDAEELCEYLAGLGVSHIYASSFLQSVPGSTHGYDITNYSQINKEIGGWTGYESLRIALRRHGLGQILDIVPNHMAINSPENVWWLDVLENGPSSPYALYFDVDWNFGESRFDNKIILPILGNHYGRVLEALEIRLSHDKGLFSFHYHDHVLPVSPNSLAGLLKTAAAGCRSDVLGFLADSLKNLPLPMSTDRESIRRRHRDKEVIRLLLGRLMTRSEEVLQAVDQAVQETNSDPEALHAILEQQVYRLAYWRMAGHELGYRRFFDINSMVGLRIEDSAVFSDVHDVVLRFLKTGILDGIRIDHPDGLWDPVGYFSRLREEAPDAWIVVEKILHPFEKLREDWPVNGTTGYDFMNAVSGLFVDSRKERQLTDFYREFTGDTTDYRGLLREKKYLILNDLLDSDVNRLTDLMVRICEHNRRFRDFTRYEIREAILEIIASLPVYRTYIRAHLGQVPDTDRKLVEQVVETALANRTDLDQDLIRFIGDVILLRYQGELETEFVMRFQQLSDPAAAKGIEDTAFYCYTRLVCLNEVGGDPGRFGSPPAGFHRSMQEKAGTFPGGMNATSTHDTKRSEDVRARLFLISEIPGEWIRAVRRWSERNEKHRRSDLPNRNTEYLIYQTMVGAWPIGFERLSAYTLKAVREAKRYTSWTRPDPAYEEAVTRFLEGVTGDQGFLSDLNEFVQPLVYPGRINSLAQTMLKCIAPGVPDLYQGTELWDLSLVDPDNRRPVDYSLRKELLANLEDASPETVLAGMDSGLPKLWVIRECLRLRKDMAEFFHQADYRALRAEGKHRVRVIACIRGDKVAAVCPRLTMNLNGDWGDTHITLPEGAWLNRLTLDRWSGRTFLQDLFSRFPVALLAREGD